jgi:hypothetical protein
MDRGISTEDLDATVAGPRNAAVRKAVFALPGLLVVGADVLSRRKLLAEYTREAWIQYLLFALLSVLLWGALTYAATRSRRWVRWSAMALLGLTAFASGVQLYTAIRYGTYLSWRVAVMGSALVPPFTRYFKQELLFVFAIVGPVVAILVAARKAELRPRASKLALGLGAAALVFAVARGSPTAGWDNGAPPDVLYLAAVGALARSKVTGHDIMTALPHLPGARSPRSVPALPPGKRSVILIVTESVRATDYGATHGVSLRQMRAVDSSTAISLAVLWSGLSPGDTREALHSAPLLWEYARAAGMGTGFWTAQNLLFANSGRWLEGIPFDRSVSATEVEPYATYQCGADDGNILDRALGDIASLKRPYLGVIQLSNTHFPYWIDEADAPETSAARAARGGKDDEADVPFRYKDAIRRQERYLTRFLGALRARGDDAVVIFVSDHGEAMRERGAVGHTWSLYDEEIRVPFWIDGLRPEEQASLQKLEQVPLTTLDVVPTVLDLMGLWDHLGELRAPMPGESLLRGGSPDRPTFLTNCSGVHWCATRNWGAMRGTLKLIATEDEPGGWRCFDVARDPGETRDLGLEPCAELRPLAERPGRPFDPRN